MRHWFMAPCRYSFSVTTEVRKMPVMTCLDTRQLQEAGRSMPNLNTPSRSNLRCRISFFIGRNSSEISSVPSFRDLVALKIKTCERQEAGQRIASPR